MDSKMAKIEKTKIIRSRICIFQIYIICINERLIIVLILFIINQI